MTLLPDINGRQVWVATALRSGCCGDDDYREIVGVYQSKEEAALVGDDFESHFIGGDT